MRILIATDAWEPQVNGVVRTLSRTVAECHAMGHEIEMIAPCQFKTVPLPSYPEIQLALGCYEEVRERIRTFEPAAIHIATEGPIGWATRRVCLEWKLPFTTSYHTKFPEYITARLPLVPLSWGYQYMRWFHGASGRIMVATPTLRDELAARGFKNISPWTRGVDTDLFKPGLDPIFGDLPRPIIAYVGRVAVEKNIEAFLKLDLPGSKVVVGDGPQLEDLKLRYPEAVFTGARFGDDLARSFCDADVFVFPSLTDTFGLVILEAMACGTPVAAFPAHGPIDIIPGSDAGEINEDLKTAILDCLKLDRRNVRAYAEKFSWRACAEEFVRNLEAYPEEQKVRFWNRLRRLGRKPQTSNVA